LVIAVLAVSVAGAQLPANLIAFRVAPGGLLITAMWVAGLFLLKRAGQGLPWQEAGQAPDNQDRPQGHAEKHKEQQATAHNVGTGRAALTFGAAAVVTLVAGVLLERSGEESPGTSGCPGCCSGPPCSPPPPHCRRCPLG